MPVCPAEFEEVEYPEGDRGPSISGGPSCEYLDLEEPID
jgi:hypothetical protein